MIGMLLEQMLIRLVRRGAEPADSVKESSSVKKRSDNDLVRRVIAYMEENVAGNLTFSAVCRFSAQSATNLKTIFKAATGRGVMEYYRWLKIEQAKVLLREGNGNITQICGQAGVRVGALLLPLFQAGDRHDAKRIHFVDSVKIIQIGKGRRKASFLTGGLICG